MQLTLANCSPFFKMDGEDPLEGNCSIASISAICKRLGYQPNSVGHLSAYFHYYGQGLPSTLSMPSTTVVLYLGDEIFAIHTPILVDRKSTRLNSSHEW